MDKKLPDPSWLETVFQIIERHPFASLCVMVTIALVAVIMVTLRGPR